LDEIIAGNIARAFATYAHRAGRRTILLGRDNRLSSPALHQVMAETLVSLGCDVIDLGMVITPVFYFAAKHLGIDAGIMITASHNPPEYNGFKLLLGDSTIYGEQIQDISRIIDQEAYIPAGTRGKLTQADITNDYLEMIRGKTHLGSNIPRIVVDCGNGTASLFAPELYRRLGCDVIELYCKSDPHFPHHHPDPVNPANMQDLIKKVKTSGADIGIGIDGDGDRLGVVDGDGNLIWGDMLMILFWREILPRYPHSDCIVEVKCSQSLIDEIEKLGGHPVMYKTGHSLIKAKMKELGAVFTGEMSGHMFFADDYYGYDDALYAGARLISLLSRSSHTIAEMLADVSRYYSTPEIRLPSSDEAKFDLVNDVREHFRPLYPIIAVDGARIIFPNGWGLVRASNTGPEIILRCEGKTPAALEEIKNELFGYLETIGLQPKPQTSI
jgi:phosphomannomutase / phosphoglucomutase